MCISNVQYNSARLDTLDLHRARRFGFGIVRDLCQLLMLSYALLLLQ
jgi:hypothetical protein